MAIMSFSASASGITAPVPIDQQGVYQPKKTDQICGFEVRLYADEGEEASCVVRPLAAMSQGHNGFPIGGQVTLTGTAGASGLVDVDGFPFLASFPCYGLEVVSLSGTGARVEAALEV